MLAVGTLHGFPHENYQSSIRELTPSPTVASEVSASRSRRLEKKKRNETRRKSKRSETNKRASGPLTPFVLQAQTNKRNNGRKRRSSKCIETTHYQHLRSFMKTQNGTTKDGRKRRSSKRSKIKQSTSELSTTTVGQNNKNTNENDRPANVAKQMQRQRRTVISAVGTLSPDLRARRQSAGALGGQFVHKPSSPQFNNGNMRYDAQSNVRIKGRTSCKLSNPISNKHRTLPYPTLRPCPTLPFLFLSYHSLTILTCQSLPFRCLLYLTLLQTKEHKQRERTRVTCWNSAKWCVNCTTLYTYKYLYAVDGRVCLPIV